MTGRRAGTHVAAGDAEACMGRGTIAPFRAANAGPIATTSDLRAGRAHPNAAEPDRTEAGSIASDAALASSP